MFDKMTSQNASQFAEKIMLFVNGENQMDKVFSSFTLFFKFLMIFQSCKFRKKNEEKNNFTVSANRLLPN